MITRLCPLVKGTQVKKSIAQKLFSKYVATTQTNTLLHTTTRPHHMYVRLKNMYHDLKLFKNIQQFSK